MKLSKKMFNLLLTSIVNASTHIKCVSNQKWEIQPTLINLHPNEYSRELHYYPFAVKLDKYDYRKKWIKNFSKRYIMQM